MKNPLSVIILSVWLLLFGATSATWIGISAHNFGVVTFVIGIIILVVEFFLYARGQNWFGPRA